MTLFYNEHGQGTVHKSIGEGVFPKDDFTYKAY